MTEYTIEGDTLTVGGSELAFAEEIGDVVEYDECVLVRLNTLARKNVEDNVICVESDGGIRWRIEPARSGDPYTGLGVEDGEIWAYSWDGFEYKIDPESGTHDTRRYVG